MLSIQFKHHPKRQSKSVPINIPKSKSLVLTTKAISAFTPEIRRPQKGSENLKKIRAISRLELVKRIMAQKGGQIRFNKCFWPTQRPLWALKVPRGTQSVSLGTGHRAGRGGTCSERALGAVCVRMSGVF